jgi:GT2 family glycosyltransferase
MNDPLLVSVIIVTRNRSGILSQCLRSIYMQDYSHIEVILVDNDSTDDTLCMLTSQFPSAMVIHNHSNMGAIEGRNIGVRKATGDLCLFIDDDAEFLNHHAVHDSIQYFLKDKDLACLSMQVIDANDRIARKFIPRRNRKVITEDSPGAMFVTTGCVIRRSAFEEVGGFWEDLTPYFGGEPELSYRLLDKGYRILLTPHIVVRHFEVPIERNPSRRMYYGTRNTPWLALRNLPWYSVIGLTILAWGYFFLIAAINMQLHIYCKAIYASVKHFPAVYRIRKPIGPQAVALIWKHSGLIFF